MFAFVWALVAPVAWAGKPAANPPPVVAITSPANGATFVAPANIVLSATASDSNGTVSKVEFYRGKTLIGTATTAPYSVTWANVAAGSYTVTAKATDNGGATATSSGVAITVTSGGGSGGDGNITIATPANNATVYGTSVTVSGTFVGTSTPAFVLVDNGASSRFATVTGNSYTAALPLNVGANTVTASVERTDKTSDKTTVTVNGNADPLVLITSPGSAPLSAGTNVTIAADAVSPGGNIASVSFFKGTTLLGTATSPPYQYNWTNVPSGSYSIAATGTDNNGHTATATQPVQVGPPNLLPSVSVTNPTPSAVFTAPAAIKIDATANDSDGTITQVEFLANGNVLGASNSAPYTLSWNTAQAGNYAITARATDNSGGVATSPAVNITVNSPPPVGMDSALQGATFQTPASVTLSASTDGPALGVSFYRVIDGVNAYIADGAPTNGGSPYTYSWNVRTAGTYTVVARTLMMISGFPTPFEFWSSPVTFTVTPNPAGEITYLHHDFAGSVIAATDANGAVIWKEDYRPYGERVLNDPAASNNRQFFTGKPLDQDTGLSYMGARYYDPAMGRFMGIDAVGFKPEKLHSFNRYNYANDNPYRFVDPDGKESVTLRDIAILSPENTSSAAQFWAARQVESGNPLYAVPGITATILNQHLPEALMILSTVRGGGSGGSRQPGPASDKAGNEIGRIVVDSKGNAMIEPAGGSTIAAGKGGIDTHTLFPNGSNYQRLNPQGHKNDPTPHGHGHAPGTGAGRQGQGPSLDVGGNVVPANSPAAHWPIN